MNSQLSDTIFNLINYSIKNLVTLFDWITSPTTLGAAIFLSFYAFHAIAIRQTEMQEKIKTWRYNARVFYALCAALLLSATIRKIMENQDNWQKSLLFSIIVSALIIFCLFTVIKRRERREKETETKITQ